jgi:hypothetical protein
MKQLDKDILIIALLRRLKGRASFSPQEWTSASYGVRSGLSLEMWETRDPAEITFLLKPPPVEVEGTCRVVNVGDQVGA